MPKLLLNANLSPETARFLREKFGFDVRCLLEDRLGALLDEEVVRLARQEKRVIVTFDLDFAQIYHFREPGGVGVLVLRLRNRTIASVNRCLEEFFTEFKDWRKLATSLVVVDEAKYRFYQGID